MIISNDYNTLWCGNSNKLLSERNDVDFSSASNSSQINWPMSREKRNIGNGGGRAREAETEQSGWLSDYPVLRNICNLRLKVPPYSRGRLPLLPTTLPSILSRSYRRIVGIFISISQKFARGHAFLSRGFLIESPHGSTMPYIWPTRAERLILGRGLSAFPQALKAQILLT